MTTLLLGALLPTGLVNATTFAPLTLVQQAKKADVIVQATIGIPTTVTENSQVYAVYPLKVSETLAGDAATLPQTVGSQGGGGPALFILSGVEGAPVFQSGQEVVLLLYKGRLDSPLVGYNQGAYLIANGQVGVLNAPLASAQGPGATLRQPVTPLPAPAPSASLPVATPAQTPGSLAAPGVNAAPLTPVTAAPVTVAPVSAVPAGTLPPGTPSSGTPPPATPAPVPPVPVLTLAPPSEAPAVPTSPTASEAPAVPTSPTASGTPTVSAPSAPPGAAPVPAVQNVAVPADAVATLPTAAPAGVLGTIRTPAELKAAIVAARAGQ